MVTTTKPSQQQLHSYLQARHQSPAPPPTPEEVRRQLGWGLIPHNPPPRD